MNISLNGDFESYWNSRSKNLIKNIARYKRRLHADNIVSRFLRIDTPQAIGAAVARYATLELQGWKGQSGTALSESNGQRQFYTELLERFSKSNGAMVFELWFNEKLVASRLVISSADMLIILKTTYDETLKQYAPGRLLLHHLIQSVFVSHHGMVLEFYTNANADQLAWATGQRWIKHVSLYSNAITGNAIQIMKMIKYRLTHQDNTNADQ